MSDDCDTESPRDDWAGDIDRDRQREAFEEFHGMAESYLDDGMHPEEIGMILSNITSSYKGRAEYEATPAVEYRLNFRLWEVIREIEADERYDANWQSIAFVLEDMRDMARSFARRTRGDDGGE